MNKITKELLFREIQKLNGELFDLVGRMNELENEVRDLQRPIELGKYIQITKISDTECKCE